MKNLIKYIFIILNLVGCNTQIDLPTNFEVESVKIYDFEDGSFTTNSLYSNFDNYLHYGNTHIIVDSYTTQKLSDIIKRSQPYNHFQRKHAGGILFCSIKYLNHIYASKVIMSCSSDTGMILDLNESKEYVISNQSDVHQLKNFINVMKKKLTP